MENIVICCARWGQEFKYCPHINLRVKGPSCALIKICSLIYAVHFQTYLNICFCFVLTDNKIWNIPFGFISSYAPGNSHLLDLCITSRLFSAVTRYSLTFNVHFAWLQ